MFLPAWYIFSVTLKAVKCVIHFESEDAWYLNCLWIFQYLIVSVIHNQPAGLLVYIYFYLNTNSPTVVPPTVISSLEEHYFQKNLFAETAVGEFAIGWDRVIMCEPVRVETVSRNFWASEMWDVNKLYMINVHVRWQSLFQYLAYNMMCYNKFAYIVWKIVWILISWFLMKPADLYLHCFNRQ